MAGHEQPELSRAVLLIGPECYCHVCMVHGTDSAEETSPPYSETSPNFIHIYSQLPYICSYITLIPGLLELSPFGCHSFAELLSKPGLGW